jgi:NADH-quinone oxidoreductase subunit N
MLVGEGVTDAAVTARPELVAGAMLIVGALAFKLAAVPFHMWAPDVYEGAPTPVTTFFAVVAKLAAFGILVKVLAVPFAPLFAKMQLVLVVLSALSLVVGALGGLGQNNLKRLLAYSSIGHVGFGLMAIAAGGAEGLSALIIYLAIYAVMSLGTFGVLLMLRSKGQMVETISDLAGLSKTHPWVGLGLALLMFSMAGIPPLLGFFSKLYVFMAAYNGGLIHLAILAAVCSVISAYYYLRVIKAIYVDEPAEGAAPLSLDKPYDKSVGFVVFVTVVLNVIGIALVSPLANSITQAVAAAPLP